VRLSGTTFLILEPGDNLSMPLRFMLLCCRLIAGLSCGSSMTCLSRGPRERSASPETRLLLSPAIPVIPAPCLPLRAALPEVEGTEVFLSLIELPIREDLSELIRLPGLPSGDFRAVPAVDFLVLIILPIREDLSELIRLPELPTCGCVLRTLGLLVLIELPIRDDLLELIRLLELPTCGCVPRTLGLLVLIELPIRDDQSELIRLLELPTCGCVLRTLGLLVLI